MTCQVFPAWRKDSTVERARSAGALSCDGATVSMETAHVVLDPYKISPTIGRQMNSDPLCQKLLINDLFW